MNQMFWLLMGFLSTCSFDIGFSTSLHNVQIMSEELEDEAAITVDIVAVYKKELSDDMEKMTSEEYFQKAKDLRNAHQEDVFVWRFQQPKNLIDKINVLHWPENQITCSNVFVFVDYRNKKDNRIVIPRNAKVLILKLGRSEIDNVRYEYDRKKSKQLKRVVDNPKNTILLGK